VSSIIREPLLLRAFGSFIDGATIAMGATMICLVFANVLLHQIGHDLAWTTELGQLLMVWVTFIGGAAAGRRGEHVAIVELVDLLGGRAHRWADFLAQLVAAAVLGMLVWYGIEIARGAWVDTLSVLGWPMTFEYLGLPIGSAATLVFVIYDLVLIARGVPRSGRYGE
jgi:TRAP-type C4-dicarboxylate transport system permease small subunit